MRTVLSAAFVFGKLSRQFDRLALLRFGVIDLDWSIGKHPFRSVAAFTAASSVLNSLLTRPSTSIAKPLAGRSVPDLNTGVVVLIRCARCWRMGKLRFQGFASERMKPEIVPQRAQPGKRIAASLVYFFRS